MFSSRCARTSSSRCSVPQAAARPRFCASIAGFDFPNSGEILLYGRRHRAAAAVQAAGQHRVPELRPVPAHDGRRRTSAFGLEMLGKPKAEVPARVAQMLKLVRMEKLAERRDQPDLRRPAAARGACPRTGAAAQGAAARRAALGARLQAAQGDADRAEDGLQRETGITFIFVTHDQEEALAMSDRIAVMSARQDPADRLAVGNLRPPRRALRRRFHRRDQLPPRRGEGGRRQIGDRRSFLRRRDQRDAIRRVTPSGRVTDRHPPRACADGRGRARAPLAGTVSNVVYLGTDTHIHVTLDDGTHFVVRQQNARSGSLRPRSRATRSASPSAPAVAQILKD